MAYNVSVKKYANGTMQIKTYKNPVVTDDDRADKCIDVDSDYYADIYDDDTFDWLFDEDSQSSKIIYHTPFGDIEDLTMFKEEPVKKMSPEELQKKKERSITTSMNRTVNMIYDYGRNNSWDYFLTITIAPDKVSCRTDLTECSKKIRQCFNNLKKRRCFDMKYLIVPELHPTSGALHFHGLVSGIDGLKFRIARNNAEYRKDKFGNLLLDKKGQPVPNKYYGDRLRTSYPYGDYIYNIPYFESKLGYVTATKIRDTRKAVAYLSKYITKDLTAISIGKRRYYHSANLSVPKREMFFVDPCEIDKFVYNLSYQYGMDMSTLFTKTINIDIDGYSNSVTFHELSSTEKFPHRGEIERTVI